MEQDELLRKVVTTFEELGVPYLVTGSMATIFFGEPRFTNDIDIVVQLRSDRQETLDELIRAFPEEDFYLSRESMMIAIRSSRQFNILHPASGLKVDVMVAKMDAFDHSRFSRATRVHPADDYEASFASPEDVIIKKLEYYSEGGSDKHLRDIAGVLQISGAAIDRDYVTMWARRLGLVDEWLAVVESAAGD